MLSHPCHLGVTDNQKRWLVAGIALNKILVPQIRPFVEREVEKQYNNLKTSHNIDTQSSSGRLKSWHKFLKYENINNNNLHPKLRGGKWDYSVFDCKVLSHVDFAKLYVENYMAKFNAFDDHCDASAVLTLLGSVPVFSSSVKVAAVDVRVAVRNDWAHCVFSKWDLAKFQQVFAEMEDLVRTLGLPAADEANLLGELKDWETKGTSLCMNSPVDQHLLQLVQQDVKLLENAVKHMSVESDEEMTKVLDELQKCWTSLEDMKNRVTLIENSFYGFENRVGCFENRVHGFENRVVGVEHKTAHIMHILCAVIMMLVVASTRETSSTENNFEDVHSGVGRVESGLNGFNSGVVNLKAPSIAPVQPEKEKMQKLEDVLRKKSKELSTRTNSGTKILQGEPKIPSNDCNFIGRDKEVEQIANLLKTESTRIISVYGPPGSGKSEVSKAVGQNLKSQGKAIYHIDLINIDKEDDLISAILRFFRDQLLGPLNAADFLLKQFSLIEDSVSPCFILDNADCLLQSESRDRFIHLIRQILTNCETVKILIASRESSEFTTLQPLGIEIVKVASNLDHESSEKLVRKWFPKACDENCRKIANFCGHMPFAIRLFCNNMPQKEKLPLNQAIDNFIRLIKSDLSRMDDQEELKHDRLNFILESSYQTLSRQNQEHYLSLSVIPGTFSVDVAAAVWKISVDDAERTLRSFQRKSLIESYLETGSYKIPTILHLFAKQRGEQQMKEVLFKSKARLRQLYISLFITLNERFLSGQSKSAFMDFYQDKQNIISSLIDGCSDGSTRDNVFKALIQGMLFLDTVLWSDRASFDKIYDTALTKATQHDNMTNYNHLLLAKGFSEVAWRSEEGETLQLLSSKANEVLASSSDEQKGKLFFCLGIHKLSNGHIRDGVENLKESLAHLKDTTDPTLKILKITMFQIVAIHYESTANETEATNFFKNARDECKACKNYHLFLSAKEKINTDEQNLPLVLEVHFLITKATKLFSSAERVKSFEENVLQMKENTDPNLLSYTKGGSFYLHRFIAGVLAEMTRYEEAIQLIQNLINAQERVLINDVNPEDQAESSNDDHKKALARSYSYLAVLQSRIKDYKASVESARRALDYTIDLCGEEHSDTADGYHELANIMRSLEDCNSALLFHQRALDIRLNLPEENPLKVAASYHELGVTQWEMKDYSSALQSHEKALQIRLENLGDKHRDTAKSFHELGVTQWFLEKYECALDSHEKSLSIVQDEIGENSIATADSLHEIGKTYFCLGDYHAALQSHLDAFSTRLDVLGEYHTDTANSCYEIGVTQFEMGWYHSALEYHMRALKIRHVLYTDTPHAEIAQSYYQLGRTQYQMGNFDQAVKSLNCALSVRRDLQQEQHIETGYIFYELGRVFHRKNDHTSAFVMHQFALGIRKFKVDKEDVTIGDSLFQLSFVQSKRWRFNVSRQLLKRAQDIWLKCFNTKHKCTDSYVETGSFLIKDGQSVSVFSSLQHAIQIRTEMTAREEKEEADLPYERQLKDLLSQDYKSSLQLYNRVSTIILDYPLYVRKHKDSLRKLLCRLKEQLLKEASRYYDNGNKAIDAGDLVIALHLHQRALDLRTTLLSERHEDTATSYVSVEKVKYERMGLH